MTPEAREEIRRLERNETQKRYYYNNKDKVRAANRLWRKNNPEKKIAADKRSKKNPATIYYRIRGRHAAMSYGEFTMTQEDFLNWYNIKDRKCYYCHVPEKELYKYPFLFYFNNSVNVIRLTIDRKDNNVGYYLDNIVLACRRCNVTKSNIFNHEDFFDIAQKYIKPKWQNYKIK